MGKMHMQMAPSDPKGEHGGRSLAAEEARQRLLAAMPVRETRLDLAGVSTAVLEGGDGLPVIERLPIIRHSLPALATLMEQIGSPAIPPVDLARIAVPTVMVWGRHDRATPLTVAEAASARFGWPLRVIENCAADPPIERPEALLRILRAVIDGASSGEGATS